MNKDFKHGPSENCVRVKKDECDFESCGDKLYGLRKCVGGPLALFVYRVYKIRKRILKLNYLVMQKLFPRYCPLC